MNNEERVHAFASKVMELSREAFGIVRDSDGRILSRYRMDQKELERLGVNLEAIQALFSDPRPGRAQQSFQWALESIANELSKAKEPAPTEADRLKEVISTLESQLDEAKTKLEEM